MTICETSHRIGSDGKPHPCFQLPSASGVIVIIIESRETREPLTHAPRSRCEARRSISGRLSSTLSPRSCLGFQRLVSGCVKGVELRSDTVTRLVAKLRDL
ncbi:hypothetical protein DPMN_086140 [Dreissena polymorpha]|uniref:Uncharacterized protein n=1 Tax=Dreissena polymorpha TaxID=45954 RepID=A0A9D3YHS0_DREPO|nr:hypothetical protein DPMN_086140 [Dreissena polymorpha]